MDDKGGDKEISENKIIELEAKLLEQEHRPFQLIKNFWFRKVRYPDGNDKRRQATSKAILFRFLFSPTTIALAGTGIISFFTIYFMYRQTSLLENQNKLFQSQNIRIEQQTQLLEGSRRSSQVFILGEVLSDMYEELKSKNNKERILTDALVGRIIGLSSVLKPYKYLEDDKLIDYSISPERGQLLLALLESNLDSTFLRDRILKKVNLTSSDLSFTDLESLNLNDIQISGSSFRNAYFRKMNFVGSVMTKSIFKNSNLNEVDFSNAILVGSDFSKSKFYNVNFTGANFVQVNFSDVEIWGKIEMTNAIVSRKDWIEYIRDSVNLSFGEYLEERYFVIVSEVLISGGIGNPERVEHYKLIKKQ